LLYDVYFIPKLKSNLISLGQLTEIGYKIEMDDDLIEVTEKSDMRIIMRVQRSRNRLYKIELKIVEPVNLLANVNDQSWLWHDRLGHVNFESVRMLVEKEMAGGLPLIKHLDQVWHFCLSAKQTRTSFPKCSRWRSDEPLELIHVDLCGPITPKTIGGNKYFMLLVDDCTRWMLVSILKTKDQACSAFVKFKAEAKNSLGYKIKMVRSDRGGEFLAVAFRDVCESTGIKRQFTTPYSPQ
jgi:transposase InsO family protein